VAAAAPRGIELDPLAATLARPLDLQPDLSLDAELIEGGRSNLTYLLRQGGRRWALRRPPLGHRQPTAHSMRREFQVLEALVGSDVPAPRPLFLCEDAAVLGAEFYVMEWVDGRILRSPADVTLAPAEARRCSLALAETLAALHLTPYERLGLEGLGRPRGYVKRQVRRWTSQLESGAFEPSAGLSELARRLAASMPERTVTTLVHGDYRIDNVVLGRDDAGRIEAVLDWEMATLGDPLADLGMLLMYWGRPGERQPSEVHAVTAADGFVERDELIAAYERATGFPLEELDFFVVLAHFKLAVIVANIVARHAAGETVGAGFQDLAGIPDALVASGLEIASASAVPGLRGGAAR
jgi:aminoglycoside phosphotransferase (APT) family kinase protein